MTRQNLSKQQTERANLLANEFSKLVKQYSDGDNRITPEQNKHHVERMNYYNSIAYPDTNISQCVICGDIKSNDEKGYRCMNEISKPIEHAEKVFSVAFRMIEVKVI